MREEMEIMQVKNGRNDSCTVRVVPKLTVHEHAGLYFPCSRICCAHNLVRSILRYDHRSQDSALIGPICFYRPTEVVASGTLHLRQSGSVDILMENKFGKKFRHCYPFTSGGRTGVGSLHFSKMAAHLCLASF